MREIVNKLLNSLSKYDTSTIYAQIITLEDLKKNLEENNTDEVSKEYKAKLKKRLFPPKGGLSDFFVWKDDFEEREAINSSISLLLDELWESLKG